MTAKELQNIVKGELLSGNSSLKIKGFSVDTRVLQKNEAFVALSSHQSDGHAYIKEAILKKASCIIVTKDVDIKTKIPIIKVASTYEALFDIGKYYRKKYPILYIGITGSNGKTTTKELLYTILSKKYHILKTEKNYNNHIGIPLTLSHLSDVHEIALIEMGMNHQGEIEKLSQLVEPHIGIITNIGVSHIGNLGSQKNIYKAKLEITKNLSDGILLVNGDDKYLKKVKSTKKYDVIHCGCHSSYHLKPYHVKSTMENLTFSLNYRERVYTVKVPVLGSHFLADIMLAIETSLLLGFTMEEILLAIKEYKPSDKRMKMIEKNNYKIIDDCYNASYDSFKGFIHIVKGLKEDKIIVVGDMLELGKYSKKYHLKLKKQLKKIKNCQILLIGDETKYIKGKNMIHFEKNEDVISFLKKQNLSHHVIAFKASRAMHLEDIINSL